MLISIIKDFEEIKEWLGYSKEDLMFDYKLMLDYFGAEDKDVIRCKYVIDNYSMLNFWYLPFYFLKEFYSKGE
jgi:hypothetical protein